MKLSLLISNFLYNGYIIILQAAETIY